MRLLLLRFDENASVDDVLDRRVHGLRPLEIGENDFVGNLREDLLNVLSHARQLDAGETSATETKRKIVINLDGEARQP